MQKIKISHLSMWAETASPGPFPLSRAQPASATHDSSGPLTPDPHCPALSRVLALSSHCWWDPPPPPPLSAPPSRQSLAAEQTWPPLPRARHGRISRRTRRLLQPSHRSWWLLPYIMHQLYQLEASSLGMLVVRNRRRWGAPLSGIGGCDSVPEARASSGHLSTFEEAICGIGWTGKSLVLGEFLTGKLISAVGHGASCAEDCVVPVQVRMIHSDPP
jgi:hypothetical protein